MGNYIIHNGQFYLEDELMHYGVKGMKWGVRRYQRKDGSLTEAGKKRLAKNITSKKTSTIEAKKYAKEAIDSVGGFKRYKKSEAYRRAQQNVNDYRSYKETYWKLHDRIRWDTTADIAKKYGDYDDLKRKGDVDTLKKFDKDFKKAMDTAYKKNDLYAMEEALVRKYERVLDDRLTVTKLGGKVVEDMLGKYGDKPLHGQGSAVWGYGRVIDRIKVRDIVNEALTEDIASNASRPFNGWEVYRIKNKTEEQQLKDLDSAFKTTIQKAERDGKEGAYLDLLQDQWASAHDEYERGENYPRTIREHVDAVNESWDYILERSR